MKSIQNALTLGFALVVGALAILVLLAYAGLARISEAERVMVGLNYPNGYDLLRLQSNLNAERLDVLAMIASPSSAWDPLQNDLEERTREDDATLKKLVTRFQYDPAELARLRELIALHEAFARTRLTEVLPRLRAGRTAEAKEFFLDIQAVRHRQMLELARKLETGELAEVREIEAAAGKFTHNFLIAFLSVGGAAIAGAVGLTVRLRRTVAGYAAERHRAMAALSRANRLLRMLSDSNQVLVRAKSEAELLHDICATIVHEGGYRLAWIGYAEDDAEKTVRPAAYVGAEESCVPPVPVSWADTVPGRGPTGSAIRTGEPSMCRDIAHDPDFTPWHEAALNQGYGSSLAVPLVVEGRVVGALSICAAETDAFAPAEVKLLVELADDLSFGLQTLRSRGERRQAQAAALRMAAEWQTTFDSVPDQVMLLDKNLRITRTNRAAVEFLGGPAERLIGQHCHELMHAANASRVKCPLTELCVAKTRAESEFLLPERGIWLSITVDPVFDAKGEISQVVHVARDITERKRTEEKLRRASAYNRSLIEASLDPLVTISAEGKITDVNETSVLSTGVPREKLIGTDFSDYFTNPKKAREGYQQVFQNGSVRDYPLAIRHVSGRITEVLYNAAVYRDAQGQVLGVFAAARDVTAQRRAEALQARLAAVVESASDAIISKGLDGAIHTWNPAAVRLFGYRAEEIVGRSVELLIPDHRLREEKEILNRIRSGESLEHYESSRLDREGREIAVSLTVSPIKDPGGNVVGASTIMQDITERQQVQAALRRASAYNRSLIEASLDPLVTIGPDGKITDVNAATEFASGRARDELIGTDFSDYFTEPDKARTGYQRVFHDGFVRDYPLELRHCEGHVTPVLYNAAVYRDEQGQVTGVFAAARDITERKQSEEALRELNASLERRVQERTEELRQEAAERGQAEENIRRQNTVLQGINRIFQEALGSSTDEELGRTCLKVANEITASPLGFLGEIGPDGLLHDVAMSELGWAEWQMTDVDGNRRKPGALPIRGLYGRVLQDGRSFFTNNPASHPDCIGVPDGHPPLSSFLGVPFLRGGQVTGMIAVANRVDGYRPEDQESLEALAPAMVEAFACKRAEAALRAGEAALEEAQELAHLGNWYWDAQTDVTLGSAELLRIFGFDPATEAMPTFGEQKGRCYPPAAWERVNAAVHETLRTGDGYELEVPALRAGAPIWVATRSAVVRNGEGRIVGLRGTVQDITARKETEISLTQVRSEAEKRAAELQAVFEAAPVAVWIAHDPQCRRITGNRYANEVIMQVPQEANVSSSARPGEAAVELRTYRDGTELKPEELPAQVAAATGRPVAPDVHTLVFAGGRRVQMLMGAVPLFDPAGRVRGSVAAGVDVTSLKRAELELQQTAAGLKVANKELETFSYSVSHDLRAPLRNIDGFSQIIFNDYAAKLDDRGRDYLSRVRAASQRMGELIDDFLKLAMAVRTEMRLAKVDLSALAHEVLAGLRQAEPARHVTWTVAPALSAVADRSLLRVVLQNLLGNAWKFTGTQADARIEFGALECAGERVFFVRDNGAGFDATYAGKMFTPFQRLHSHLEFPGNGIGLATVQRIIHRHGGRVWAEGMVNEGATFYFTLSETPRKT